MAVEIEITPGSEAFDPEDARWLAQVAGLTDELRQEGVPLRTESTPVPGEKGDIVTIIAALGSAGVFSALVTVIQSWLSRERTRHVDIKIRSSGGTKHITIDGDTSNETIENLAREAMGQADGA
jgi:Effector Associated Constant Component 1